jgi:hypothetical protein
MGAAWLAALGASMMMMGAHAYGRTIQKPITTPKSLTAKPLAAPTTPTATLTGCLRMDGMQFELTNLKGSDVRTSRTWKSGFIKKAPKNVEVVGASANLKLKDHVGREVRVVGTRSDETHLRATSIKLVATSCAS